MMKYDGGDALRLNAWVVVRSDQLPPKALGRRVFQKDGEYRQVGLCSPTKDCQ